MKKSEKTKLKIMNNALMLFYKNGYKETTTKEIAEKSNISEATIFKYFKTKKNLLISSIANFLSKDDLIFESIITIIENNKDGSIKEILKKIVYNRNELFENYYPIIMVILNESKNHKEIKDIFEKKLINRLEIIGNKIIQLGKENGEIKEDLNNNLILRTWISNIFFMMMNKKVFPSFKTNLNFEEEINNSIEILFNGIGRNGLNE